jgi:hypothetical protein
MAINATPDIRCDWWEHWRTRRPPAVAVISDPTAKERIWQPRCADCVNDLIPGDDRWDVAYLHGHDPAAPRPDPPADLEPADRDRPDRP